MNSLSIILDALSPLPPPPDFSDGSFSAADSWVSCQILASATADAMSSAGERMNTIAIASASFPTVSLRWRTYRG